MKSRFPHLRGSLAALCLLLAAGTSQAAVFDIDGNTGTAVVDPLAVGSYNPFSAGVTPGTFVNQYRFIVPTVSTGSFGVGPLNFTVAGLPILNITNLDMGLYMGAVGSGTLLAHGLDFTYSPLAAGNYYLQVSGQSNGFSGGQYAGSLILSAVPEPQSWAMLLGGVLLAFGLARIRAVRAAV